MIPTMSALPGSGVTLSGRGPDDFKHVGLAGVRGHGSGVGFFGSPGLYKAEQNGARGRRGRSMERKDEQDGAQVRVEGREERELVNGAGTRRGAQWQARGLRGDHRREKGRRGGHSQGGFAGASAVQSARKERQLAEGSVNNSPLPYRALR